MEETELQHGSDNKEYGANSSGAVKSETDINGNHISFDRLIGISDRFALINRLVTRDMNSNNKSAPTFKKYTKDQIATYLSDPYKYEKELRTAVRYIYGASSHFRRLVQYFSSLTDLSYVVAPYRVDPKSVNLTTMNRNYRKVLNALSSMSIKTQFPKIITTCLREDTFFGTMWVTNDSINIQQLPSEYCSISTIEWNVPNVTFDFSYFNNRQPMLDYFPAEFRLKYDVYKRNKNNKWIELDSPTSFAIKCNTDTMDYSIPPFAGILREVYEIEEYKELKISKTALENYAMIYMTLGMDNDGNWSMDLEEAKKFWRNLDSVLPPEIGSVLTPMPIEKVSFEKSNTATANTVAEAEDELFSAAGVSSLLFNNTKASANALSLSIKADQAITYGIVKSIEDMINRYIQSQNYGKNFKVNFLDVSPYNRKEVGDMYLKAAQYGMPTVSLYCASQGLSQAEIDSMNVLENDVMEIKKLFIPLQSSSTLSGKAGSESNGATDDGGAPQKDADTLSESGLQKREDA